MRQSVFVAGLPDSQKAQRPPPNRSTPARPTALPPQVSTATAAPNGKGKAPPATRSSISKSAKSSAAKKAAPAVGSSALASKNIPAVGQNTPPTSKNVSSARRAGPSTSGAKKTPAARAIGNTLTKAPQRANSTITAAQQAVAAAEAEAASEDQEDTSGQARAVALMMFENEQLRRELQALRAHQEQQLYEGEDEAIEKIIRPPGEAGSRTKGFVLIEAMRLNGTERRQELYHRIQGSVRERIIQSQLDQNARFAAQDSDKIRDIVHLLRKQYRYLCQARFPGGWPIIEMIKSNLRNGRKYRNRKKRLFDLEFDIGVDGEDEDDEPNGSSSSEESDAHSSNIDPELQTQAEPSGEAGTKKTAEKRKRAVGEDQTANSETPAKRARSVPSTDTEPTTLLKPSSKPIPHYIFPQVNSTPPNQFAAAEEQEVEDDPEADEDEEEEDASPGSTRIVIKSTDGHVIYADNSDEEDDGSGPSCAFYYPPLF